MRTLIFALLFFLTCNCVEAQFGSHFIRGDVTGDGWVDYLDPIVLYDWLFVGQWEITCVDAGDFDDNGVTDVSDVILMLYWLEDPYWSIPAPWPVCGMDWTEDEIECDYHLACE